MKFPHFQIPIVKKDFLYFHNVQVNLFWNLSFSILEKISVKSIVDKLSINTFLLNFISNEKGKKLFFWQKHLVSLMKTSTSKVINFLGKKTFLPVYFSHSKGDSKISWNRHCVSCLFTISGISRLRGVVMYELQSTLSCYAKRKYSSGEISVDHLKNILKVRETDRHLALKKVNHSWQNKRIRILQEFFREFACFLTFLFQIGISNSRDFYFISFKIYFL